MRHLMLDIETLGTSPGCVVLSIGAVEFGLQGNITGKFHSHLDTSDQTQKGLHIDAKTVEWWLDQDKVAQEALLSAERFHPKHVIEAFIDTFAWENIQVWANGASFDFPIIKALFEAYDFKLPWPYYSEMDFRTVKNMVGKNNFNRLRVRPTLAHDALSDAEAQAMTLVNIINWINGEHNDQRIAA